jgi:ankyrin repeat protein
MCLTKTSEKQDQYLLARALHTAIRSGNLRACRFLIGQGLKTHSWDSWHRLEKDGGTPVHTAVIFEQQEIMTFLLDLKLGVDDLDRFQQTPLHLAALNRSTEICELLLAHGANVNARDVYLRTPIMNAAQRANERILQLLLKSGADLEIQDYRALTATYYALDSIDAGNITISLLSDRCCLHRQDISGRPYGLRAFGKYSPRMNTYLLNSGLDLEVSPTRFGNLIVVSSGDLLSQLKRVVRRLPQAELSTMVNCRPTHEVSALYNAAIRDIGENLEFLLQAGAHTEKEGGPYGTPLMGACDAGRLEATKVLVRAGAIISYINHLGVLINAVSVAKYHPAVVQWLLVGRHIDQGKICEVADESTRGKEYATPVGYRIVELPRTRPSGLSWLHYLCAREEERRSFFGTVYIP